jgi:hypothetical protein
MKTKLLKRLRKQGRNMVNIYSVTTCRGLVTGMSYGYSSPEYSDLFFLGDTEDDVRDKAMRIYITNYIERKRKRK